MKMNRDEAVQHLKDALTDRIVAVDIVALVEHFEARVRMLEEQIDALHAERASDAQLWARSVFGEKEANQ